ncbi:hypothetical protein BDZ94DRAFT_73403 [Collybia nuda]|uniref:Uncharacterized protein n=1 Tax=Collybia nuda TaxID=64659 RepID=A0A9P5XVV4_9AGAR|nr:hypothetical protein BDZ94DRAFT_73403 [Collybia nuda]
MINTATTFPSMPPTDTLTSSPPSSNSEDLTTYTRATINQSTTSATPTQPSTAALGPSPTFSSLVNQTPHADSSSPKKSHKGEVAGGVVGGIVIILTMFLIWRRCHKSRRILIHDKEKAAARHSIRQPSIWSLVSPTSTMLAEAASFDPTRMVKTGSPFDKRAFLENNPAGEVHPLPNNLL